MSIVDEGVQGMAAGASAAWLAGADLVELRLDCIGGLTEGKVDQLLTSVAHIRVPKVVTIMPTSIFGRYAGGDRERAKLLARAADRADYVDVNYEMDPEVFGECMDGIAGGGAKPLVSWHSGRMIEPVQRQGILRTSAPYDAIRLINTVSGAEGTTSMSDNIPIGPFPALTDIGFKARVTAGTAIVSVNFEIILESTT